MKPIEQIKRRLSLTLKNFSTTRREALPEIDELERQVEELSDVHSISAWYAKSLRLRPKRRILPVSLLSVVSIDPQVSSTSVQYVPLSKPILGKQTSDTLYVPEDDNATIVEYADTVLKDQTRSEKQEKRYRLDSERNSHSFLSLVKRMKKRLSDISSVDQEQSKSTSLFYLGLISLVGIASIMIVGKVASSIPSFSSIIRGIGWSKNVEISTETTARQPTETQPVLPKLTLSKEKTKPVEVELTNKQTELNTSAIPTAINGVLSPLQGGLLHGANLAKQQNSIFQEYLVKSSKLNATIPLSMVSGRFRADLNELQNAAQKLKNVPSTISSCCSVPPLLARDQGVASETPQVKLPSLPVPSATSAPATKIPLKPTEQQGNVASTTTAEVGKVQPTVEVEPPKPQSVLETSVFSSSLLRQATRVVTQPNKTTSLVRQPDKKATAIPLQAETPSADVLKKDKPLQRLPDTSAMPSNTSSPRKTVSTQGKVSLLSVPLVPYDDRLYESNLVRL